MEWGRQRYQSKGGGNSPVDGALPWNRCAAILYGDEGLTGGHKRLRQNTTARVSPMKMRVGSNPIKSEYRLPRVANETLYQLRYTPV